MRRRLFATVWIFIELAIAAGSGRAGDEALAEARRIVEAATQPAAPWNGPRTGPPAQSGKHVVILGEDLRNGGILGVAQGVREAARVIGWSVAVFDAGGSAERRRKVLADALAGRVDGLVLLGPDARDMLPGPLPYAPRGTPIVAGHVGAAAGPVAGTRGAMD